MGRIYGYSFLLLCLFVLSYAHDHHDHDHHHEAAHFKYTEEANVGRAKMAGVHLLKQNLRTESPQQLWLETFGSVSLISLAPFLVLCILPDLNKYPNLLKIFLAFAAGGLLGDAFLHLIPHAVDSGHHQHGESHGGSHEHVHEHRRHMIVGLSVVSGIFVFLSMEKLIRLVHHQHGGRGHSHTGGSNGVVASSEGKNKKAKKSASVDGSSEKTKSSLGTREFRVAGYLNLAADFTHNFTDGLAIGASFLMSRNLGIVTTLTVLFHELPHEIGDYAILIQSGCSARKAMFLQLSTAIGAAIGASLSLLAAGVGIGSVAKFEVPLLTDDLITGCVLPFTAGGFIYIAMTSVLPDLLGSTEEHVKGKHPATGVFKRLTQSIAEVLSLIAGIAMMAVLGTMEQ